jgi:hypothetical protein
MGDRLVPDHFDSLAQLYDVSTARHGSNLRRRLYISDLGYTQAKYYFQLNIFSVSINFVDLLYMLFCSSDPPSTCSVAWQCQHIGRQT